MPPQPPNSPQIVRRERKTVEEFRFHQEGERRAVRAADLRDKIRQLEHDAALMRQIDLSGTGAVEISTDDPAAPSHICELVSDSGHQALLSAREKSCTPT